jgi:hypothetical protein
MKREEKKMKGKLECDTPLHRQTSEHDNVMFSASLALGLSGCDMNGS